jgi:hypothetical protein
MPITPDTKNWTWVVERPCPECGFNANDYPREMVARTMRSNAAAWVPVLGRADASVRPNDDRWSALEYACHVRDVYRIFDVRLEMMLHEDNPVFQSWNQDVTAVEERYDLQNPSVVLGDLLVAAGVLADKFDALTDDQWTRTGTRSDGNGYTIATLGTLGLHDPMHHLWDVTPR